MRTALFAGTFDPPTFGHLDLIERSIPLCDHLIVAVSKHPTKTPIFTLDERVHMLKIITKGHPTIEIAQFQGLTLEFAKEKKANFLIRGLRGFIDFEYELQMSIVNQTLGKLETVFLMAHTQISSSLVREVASNGGSLKDFVPKEIESLIAKKWI